MNQKLKYLEEVEIPFTFGSFELFIKDLDIHGLEVVQRRGKSMMKEHNKFREIFIKKIDVEIKKFLESDETNLKKLHMALLVYEYVEVGELRNLASGISRDEANIILSNFNEKDFESETIKGLLRTIKLHSLPNEDDSEKMASHVLEISNDVEEIFEIYKEFPTLRKRCMERLSVALISDSRQFRELFKLDIGRKMFFRMFSEDKNFMKNHESFPGHVGLYTPEDTYELFHYIVARCIYSENSLLYKDDVIKFKNELEKYSEAEDLPEEFKILNDNIDHLSKVFRIPYLKFLKARENLRTDYVRTTGTSV